MKISESIVQGLLSGGSQAPVNSATHRSWNRYWGRFFKTCADHLLGWLVKNFPNLNHVDAEEVIGPVLLKTYKSLKERFDPEKDKIESWVFTNAKRAAIDLLRKKSRSPESIGVSFDDTVDGKDSLPLYETIGTDDAGFEAAENVEIQIQRKEQISEILMELEAQGKCERYKIEIYLARQNGEAPTEVAQRFGKKADYVNSTKNEIAGRLTFITGLITEGVSLRDAVSQSTAKKKPVK